MVHVDVALKKLTHINVKFVNKSAIIQHVLTIVSRVIARGSRHAVDSNSANDCIHFALCMKYYYFQKPRKQRPMVSETSAHSDKHDTAPSA
jgi:hypothetical protein